ncbi:G5 domain-containing protein [Anaerococcus obesiensis]|uniref:G5 domain-containing protein n=1 Tax=Anaerococcus obesiensis TaxID=1287640 RepID=A0A7T7UU96_9FIRM|nr:G5 domain-containing protein [Anaerococcus obesiensis]QQN56313.1 G5 domain-containing protein [Anaerococcus obesiensis]
MYTVTGSSLDNLGTKTEITNVRFTQDFVKNHFRLKNDSIPSSVKGNILVEIETYYEDGKGIGLGADYISNTRSSRYNTNWIGESYASEDKINKGPVITYDYVWKFENDIQPSTIDVPEPDKYEDETWTVEGKAGKLYRKYKRELADGVATGNEEKTEETKEDPAPVPNEYHHGTKKRPESRTTNPVSLTKEIPFDTITTDDPNLKQGEIEVDVDGENGQAEYKYSVTFDRKMNQMHKNQLIGQKICQCQKNKQEKELQLITLNL